MLAGLGHGTVGCGNHKDGTVHLGGTGNHVLHIVGVTGAVHVCIVTGSRLVLYVRGINRDTAFLLLRSVVDRVEAAEFREALLCKYGGNCGGEGRFTVVHVSDGTDIYVRLGPVKFLFCHNLIVI